mmetsp:Transcript_17927/g.34495  ORF Transcript_17927/g.34495 Transcript_17927/m.34495 type:complete len:107 (-) Transcript_17927:423-743(-)|eukprot:CAMPEP_0172747530 /NCGR_PEP_ID=MMETSP1074-20121228/142980_1 /TAXON_ID=2916 /ORGANISM="Ceratium fusus, Strain PA161109" /LENGTH=106 /DNA_ID=CAMNT_0013579073 /DNA_START=257 /DNA_END=577 /DNA_ORIENTATION=+
MPPCARPSLGGLLGNAPGGIGGCDLAAGKVSDIPDCGLPCRGAWSTLAELPPDAAWRAEKEPWFQDGMHTLPLRLRCRPGDSDPGERDREGRSKAARGRASRLELA